MTLARALMEDGRVDEAIATDRALIARYPNTAEAHGQLGIALTRKDSPSSAFAAVAALRRAAELAPMSPEVHRHLAYALERSGDYTGAIYECRRAIALWPDHAEAHNGLALLLLRVSQFKEGWAEHEWRRRLPGVGDPAPRNAPPRWSGGAALAGKTILLYREQGFGDSIHFVRYVPLMQRRGARIVLMCQAALVRLFQGLPDVIAVGSKLEELPPADLSCSLLDLPEVFRTDVATIPASIPYLKAPPISVDEWERRLAASAAPGTLRVGLAWAGNAEHYNDLVRSIPLQLLRSLARVQNVRFYSLQVGPAAGQQRDVPELPMVDHTAELRDFAETAAMVSQLDLVIAPDTAIAHLAGALGKPVWVMLPFVPDWRWMLDRSDSPWYPTMRLFRQPRIGDWEAVGHDVGIAMKESAKARC
jgi:hypothetical protein